MGHPTLLTLLSLSLFIMLLPIVVSSYSLKEAKQWCSQTPNPAPCEYFLTQNTYNFDNIPLAHESNFLKISTKLALERARHAKTNAYALGAKCRNEKEKAAWADCLELYDYTIAKLNKTYDPNTKCSQEDSQTWLSTALTNMETCKSGFLELGVDDYVLPLMSNNVTQLISNTLSLNKLANNTSFDQTSGGKSGFPKWVKPGVRKLLQTSSVNANLVVAADGSGNYKTVSAAVAAAKSVSSGHFVIHVKAGTYNENVQIKLKNIMLVGDGIGKTIITGSKSVGGGSTTFNSATVAVTGDGFIAKGITFRNTAGAQNHQAVAFRSGSDLSVLYQCSFEGYQDTLYVYSDRQFYRNCDIYGTVDFIFGNAAVVFQNCNIYARNPPNKVNTITAQGRTDPNQNTGISIHDCTIAAASDLVSVQSSVKTYLGRPWQEYSRTVFMKSNLGSLINSAGWLPWSGDFALSTLYYGEYANTGAGSSTSGRVTWGGYHVITSATVASQFTVGNFISGGSWLQSTGIPFTSGL